MSFPKSHDISKAIDKAAGAGREVVGIAEASANRSGTTFHGAEYKGGWTTNPEGERTITAPATDAAALWDGWGTALKPAYEPIIVAMKPRDGTFTNNALTWGVAGLWIDGARVPTDGESIKYTTRTVGKFSGIAYAKDEYSINMSGGDLASANPQGRWPANLILDEEAAAMLDAQSGESCGGKWGKQGKEGAKGLFGLAAMAKTSKPYIGDTGGASRFFYCAKASRAERNAGLEGMEERAHKTAHVSGGRQRCKKCGGWYPKPMRLEHRPQSTCQCDEPEFENLGEKPQSNHHPTVKPVALLEYLCRLTKTPTGGVVLDPFMGSGSTGIACANEGRDFIGIEIDADYYKIAQRRIEHAQGQVRQPMLEGI